MTKEFNLTDEIQEDMACEEYLEIPDVKKFIRLLKESLEQGVKRTKVLPLDWAFDRIDKLAGEKLL